MNARLAILSLSLAALSSCSDGNAESGLSEQVVLPIIIGHRGASGERPEHTQAAYELAIEQGADYIEPDLVVSKDGILMVRHENEISGTTNISTKPEFADRYTTKIIDGRELSGWFTEDFTYNELKTLRAKERMTEIRPDNRDYDNEFDILSFEELLKFVQRMEQKTGRVIGIYPEIKHPAYFKSIGLPHQDTLLKQLNIFGYRDASDAVFIQSFEVGALKELSDATEIRLVQLVHDTYAPPDKLEWTPDVMISPAGLKNIANYADAIGIAKSLVIDRTLLGRLDTPSDLVKNAHANDLLVHIWTMRAENYFLPEGMKSSLDPIALGDLKSEIRAYREAGVDGFFSDHPSIALEAFNEY